MGSSWCSGRSHQKIRERALAGSRVRGSPSYEVPWLWSMRSRVGMRSGIRPCGGVGLGLGSRTDTCACSARNALVSCDVSLDMDRVVEARRGSVGKWELSYRKLG